MIRSRKPGHLTSHVKRRVRSRHGGLLIWVLPAVAALALATLWLTAPSQPDPASPTKPQTTDAAPHNEANPPAIASREVPTSTHPAVDGPAPRKVTSDPPAPQTPQKKTLEETQQAVTGEWTSFYQGQRRLTVLDGGKATMVVEPEGLAAVLLAPKLTFEVLWKITGDHIEFDTVGGEPGDKVNVVVKMYGKHRIHKIVDLKPDRIVLLDEDGVTEYVWSRVINQSR